MEFPKWIIPHASHNIEALTKEGFDIHRNRANEEVTVLVQSEEQEARLLAEHVEPIAAVEPETRA